MKLKLLTREILFALKGREEYGYSIAKTLASKGNKLHLGHLYETLGNMEGEKMVKSRWEKGTKGPKRKLYSLTDKGEFALKVTLKDSLQVVNHFYNAYLASLAPEKNVTSIIFNAMKNLFPTEKIQVMVFIITFSLNPALEAAIRMVQKTAKEARLYLVKPPKLEVTLNLQNLVVLDGIPEDVPLKNSFADGIYLESIFSAQDIPKCVKELKRVTKLGGLVAFGAPHLHMADAQDPLDIGEYVEKTEYELSEGTGIVPRARIEEEISRHLALVQLLKAGPVSVFVARRDNQTEQEI